MPMDSELSFHTVARRGQRAKCPSMNRRQAARHQALVVGAHDQREIRCDGFGEGGRQYVLFGAIHIDVVEYQGQFRANAGIVKA